MNLLYKWRGLLLALLALGLVLLPPCAQSNWLVGAPLLLAGLGLRVWARSCIGMHTRGAQWAAPALVVTGPYARMRHPLYASNGLVGLAFAWFHLGAGITLSLFTLVFFAFLAVLARAEDRWLGRRFGDAWRDWAARVPAWGWARANGGALSQVEILRIFVEDRWTWIWWSLGLALIAWRKSGLA